MILVVCLSFSGYLVRLCLCWAFHRLFTCYAVASYVSAMDFQAHVQAVALIAPLQVSNVPVYFRWIGKVSYFSYAYAAMVRLQRCLHHMRLGQLSGCCRIAIAPGVCL